MEELSSDQVRVYAIEIASKMSNSDLYPKLVKLKDKGSNRHFEDVLTDTINACCSKTKD